MFEVRTDLAVEENERIAKAQEETKGISVTEEDYGEEQIHITTVRITTENGAKQMGKPKGTYITLEAAEMIEDDEDYHREISKRLAEILKELIPVCDKQKNYKESTENQKKVSRKGFAQAKHELEGTSILVAGLMAQTGMESQEIITGIIREVKPDYLIVVDALAARSVRRLGRTIQITDTGIYPGSGVGNHRYSITKETTGIPVIAIGIPTVVEAATIVYDSMSALIDELAHAESLQPLKTSWNRLTEAEHRNLVRELLSPQLNHMFVTPKDIDAEIKRMSYTISEAINLAFCG